MRANADTAALFNLDHAGRRVTPGVRLLRGDSMKLLSILLLTSVLLAAQPGHAQGRRRVSGRQRAQLEASAERAWPSFFTAFRAAVRGRDRAALKGMMAPDFLFSLGGGDSFGDMRDQAFAFWDAHDGRGWKSLDRTLARGAVPQARWWNHGGLPERPGRVAPAAANRRGNVDRERVDWYAVFVFHEDGRWYCEIFQECCD